MRIVHCCLASYYADGHSYQENELVREHVALGHDVTVIASTEVFSPEKRLAYTQPKSYRGTDGALVHRLRYSRMPHLVARKIRAYRGLKSMLEQIKPEVIVFHGLCAWELVTVSRYRKRNPEVRLFVDCHADRYNSARSFGANLLHRLFYRPIIRSCIREISPIHCISLDVVEFVRSMYGVPQELLLFFPLGGRVFDDGDYMAMRNSGRERYRIGESEIVLIQTGKFTSRKRLKDSIAAFSALPHLPLRLLLAGEIMDDVQEVQQLIESDARVEFLGWKSTSELDELLCASDVYLQPGSQSATMQSSLCARCAVVLDNVLSHQPFVDGNGWLVRDHAELQQAIKSISENRENIHRMSRKSLAIASTLLDYRKLAAKCTGSIE